MGELAEQLRLLMKAQIESAPRTIIPDTSAPKVIKDTKPLQKVENETKESKPKETRKEKSEVRKELPDMPSEERAIYKFNGADLELYKYFDKSPSTASKEDIEKLKYLNDWAFSKGLKSGLEKIQDVEMKIGRTDEGERLVRVYNSVRIRNLRNSR